MPFAKIRTEGVILEPIDSGNSVPGELYRDVNNGDVLTDQSTGGSNTAIGSVASDSIMLKEKQNTSGVDIQLNTPVALKSDGGIVAADSDSVDGQILIGIAVEEILNGENGQIALLGPNAKNVIQGLGFAPGDPVYLNQDGSNRGFTNNVNSLTDNDDSIIRIGYADCAAGDASATATDLILFGEVIARP